MLFKCMWVWCDVGWVWCVANLCCLCVCVFVYGCVGYQCVCVFVCLWWVV